MPLRTRITFFAFTITILIVTGYALTGELRFLYADFWFASGLLLLVLLSLVDQPHFSKDANVFVNGVTGSIALLTIPIVSRGKVWGLFAAWSLYLVASSYALMLLRSGPLHSEGRGIRLISRINREIGRPAALFSAFFLWGVLSQFGPDAEAFRVLLSFWAVFMLLNVPGISKAVSGYFAPDDTADTSAIGTTLRVISPRIVEAKLRYDAPDRLIGRTVRIACGSEESCAEATVVDDRIMAGVRIGRLAITRRTPGWQRLADESQRSQVFLEPASVRTESDHVPVSVVDKGSDIGYLQFYLNPDVQLQEGEVLWVALPDGRRAYYQVITAKIVEEGSEEAHSLHKICVCAGQLGIWKDDTARFEPLPWVPPAGELVYRVTAHPVEIGDVPKHHIQIGSVPNSSFPVHVGLEDIVTHNTAIIGVTGSGKSYLTMRLIEALYDAKVKVLVLDLTRQHWTYLQSLEPTAIRRADDVQTWLASASLVGVYQFAESTSYPKSTADFVERAFKHLSESTPLRPGTNEPARLCIVLEEAHSLIPEWNQVAVDDDKRQVNRTARCVLQGRKFGIGCIVVSQRTANVTKTILNQCNSIFALQSFDQTGLDFLRNYLGEAYANAISTLPARHAILVGKASSSARPVVLRVDDYAHRWVDRQDGRLVDEGVVGPNALLPADQGVLR